MRRNGDAPDEDALIWEYTLRQVHDLIAEALPKRQFDRLWKRLLHELNRLLLTERQLRIVSDTLHLRPVELYPEVLHAVIDALVRRPALAVIDVNVAGERSTPILHPLPQVARFNNNRSTHRMVEKTRRLRHV